MNYKNENKVTLNLSHDLHNHVQSGIVETKTSTMHTFVCD